jgi:sugar (pentulose or hexulose) kinase
LSQLLGVDALELEEAALTLEAKAGTAVMMFPYLAGGEQGALWRTDLSGVISNLHLGTSRGDLALALYEGIAFEILRCLETLGAGSSRRVVNLQGNGVRGIVPALVGALHEGDVLAVTGVSASLLGVALVALEALGARVNSSGVAQTWAHDTPILEEEYQRALRTKQAHYRATAL